jgi:hypothetical protein
MSVLEQIERLVRVVSGPPRSFGTLHRDFWRLSMHYRHDALALPMRQLAKYRAIAAQRD